MNNKYLDTWEEIHRNQDWGMWPSEPVVRFVSRKYGKSVDRHTVKILDYGCGIGSNTRFLAKSGYDTYAFDGAPTAIEKAKKLLADDNLSAHLQVSDALSIQYRENFFDCVIDSACIYANTIETIKKLYFGIYTILKRGGALFTTGLFTTRLSGYNTGEEIERNTFADIKEGNLAGRGIAHFYESKDEIYSILSEIGFKNIVIDTMTYTDRGNVVEYYMVSAEK